MGHDYVFLVTSFTFMKNIEQLEKKYAFKKTSILQKGDKYLRR